MAGIQRKYCPDAVPGSGVASLDVELMIKPYNQGADAGERLSFGLYGKVHRGKAVAANRTREIRPSGMRGGLAETWAMVELGTRCTTERAHVGNSLPKVARAVFLPDTAHGEKPYASLQGLPWH
jgi:hypothetical protein